MTTAKKSKAKGYAQQELTKFDETLDRHFEQIEDKIFNRKERIRQLEEGRIPQTNTILSAVFQEIKEQSEKADRKSTKKIRIHFFKVKTRLPVFSSNSKVEKVKRPTRRIWLLRALSSSRLLRNSTTTQGLMGVDPQNSVAYHHTSNTRFPVW